MTLHKIWPTGRISHNNFYFEILAIDYLLATTDEMLNKEKQQWNPGKKPKALWYFNLSLLQYSISDSGNHWGWWVTFWYIEQFQWAQLHAHVQNYMDVQLNLWWILGSKHFPLSYLTLNHFSAEMVSENRFMLSW